MLRFIVHRLLSSIPVLFGIVHRRCSSSPGSSRATRARPRSASGPPKRRATRSPSAPASTSRSSSSSGRYLGDLLHGDLGESVAAAALGHRRCSIERLPTTIELSIVALIVRHRRRRAARRDRRLPPQLGHRRRHDGLRQRRRVDAGVRARPDAAVLLRRHAEGHVPRPAAVGRLSPGLVPHAVLRAVGAQPSNGVLDFLSNFEILNGVLQWHWDIVVDASQHLILPALALGTIPLAIIARMTRSSLLDVLGHDYVRTARAKGFSESRVVRTPRPAQRAAAGRDGDRAVARHAVRRRHPHRDRSSRSPASARRCTTRSPAATTPWSRASRSSSASSFVLVNLVTDVLYTCPRPAGAGDVTRRPTLRSSTALEPPSRPSEPSTGGPVAAQPRPLARGRAARCCARGRGSVGAVLATLIIVMAVFAPLIAPYGPTEVLLDPAPNEKVLERPCIHLFGCADGEVAAHHGHRRQRARRVQPHRLRRPGLAASPAPAAVVFAVVDRHGHRPRRRVLRATARQRADAMHGRAAVVPVAAAGDPHRHRARARPGQRRPRHRASCSIPIYARVVRAQVLAIREQDFVTADRALGVRTAAHPLPPGVPEHAHAARGAGDARVRHGGARDRRRSASSASACSRPTPSGARWCPTASAPASCRLPHLAIFPGLLIFINVLAFNLLGDRSATPSTPAAPADERFPQADDSAADARADFAPQNRDGRP